MAARHLRRLRGEDPLAAAAAAVAASDDDDDSDDGAVPAAPAPFNPFDLLDDGEGGGGGGDDDDDEEEASSTPPRAPSPPPPAAAAKRKKKRKGKAAAAAAPLDEVDAALAELGLEAGGGGGEGGAPAPVPVDPARASALAVDPRRLRGDDEARRLFGVASSSAAGPSNGEDGGGAPPAPRGFVRRTPLLGGAAAGRGAAAAAGLSMAVVGPAPGGGTLYRYVRGPAYEEGLVALETAQATHDPRAVVGLLAARPAHADILLVVYDLLRLTGQHDAADAVLERACGSLEAAWHPSFAAAAAAATARVDGADPAARPLFVALFRRAASLSRRGLHGAAAETARLAVALDAGDRVGARLALDYYLLRAGAPGDVVALAAAGEAGDGLPNWAFSVPLARLRAGGGGGASDGAATAAASTALTRACLTFPLAVVRLADRLADAGTPPPARLAAALAKAPFARARADADGGAASAGLARVCSIFAERHHPLWRAPDALTALASAATAAVDATAAGEGAAWAAARDAAWPPTAPDAFAHLRPADFSDAVAALPEDEIAALNAAGALGGGGGPGADADADADAALAAALAAAGGVGGGGRGARGAAAAAALREMHPLAALLHTLLPWNDEGGGEGGGEVWEDD